ncbi:MAG: hypothetical protein JST43_06195 [Bacteroidetes bacterium]|nr:hypothetical protein [Bacteroidota bacterium]MBS1539385.1 hypothetical protein [Bacteroidota bacterium]
MKQSTQYTISLIVSFALTVIGAMFKIVHWEGSSSLLSAGLICGLPFIYLGITDVYQNKKQELLVKLMWTVGFIFISSITGLVYLNQYQKHNSN